MNEVGNNNNNIVPEVKNFILLIFAEFLHPAVGMEVMPLPEDIH